MAMLEVQNIRKSFGKLEVLKGIDFSLEKGQVLSIIGSSGSGKTTLLRCLTFLERAEQGSVSVNGDTIFDAAEVGKISAAEQRRRQLHFGLVFQNFNLFPQYTVLQNVCLAPKLQVKERPDYKQHAKEIIAEIEAKAHALIDQVGLSAKCDAYPWQLSGGQQQRVAIARALALDPEILFFDEPTSALDPELTGEILHGIKDLAGRRMTMVIVTHEMQFAREVSDKVLFKDGGLVLETGSPEQVFDHPEHERTREFLSRFTQA